MLRMIVGKDVNAPVRHQLRSVDKATAQRRLMGFLMRRGFASDLVFQATRRAMQGWAAGVADPDDEAADARSGDEE